MLLVLTVNLSHAQEEDANSLEVFFENLSQKDAYAVAVAGHLNNAFEISKSQSEVGMLLLDSLEKYMQYNSLTKDGNSLS
ncbi:MAG: hypothetical protein ACJAXX_001466 [Roseivirga sp.]|jgi:hypothetical protein